MDNEQLNGESIDYLFRCSKTIARVFKMFESYELEYDHLEELPINTTNYVDYHVSHPECPLDRVRFYLLNKTDIPLANVASFIKYNKLKPVNGVGNTWNCDMVVAVGLHQRDILISIPLHMFPSPFLHFSVSGDLTIFGSGIQDTGHPCHQLVRQCTECSVARKKCTASPGLRCKQCGDNQCTPSLNEHLGRLDSFYSATADMSWTLSPPYQHLIQCIKKRYNANKKPQMIDSERHLLKSCVEGSYVNPGSPGMEQLVILGSKAFQIVHFKNGTVSISREKNSGGLFGFTVYVEAMNRVRAALATPHFGLAKAETAYSFIDAALGAPGEIFYLEETCMYAVKAEDGVISYNFRPTRIYIVSSIKAEDDMSLVVGWMF